MTKGMKIAIPDWQGRLAPVFDVCGRLLVVEAEGRHEIRRQEVSLAGCDAPERIRQLGAMGVDVLICGAISRYLEAALTAAGIRVLAFVCGPVETVLDGFLVRGGTGTNHRMPGCRRCQRRHGHGRR